MSERDDATSKIGYERPRSDLLTHVADAIRGGQPLGLVEAWGTLRIDRPLPFLLVHRSRPGESPDSLALVRLYQSYLWASPETADHPDVTSLTRHVLSTLAGEFGSVLLIEVWSEPPAPMNAPACRVIVSDEDPHGTVDALASALRHTDVPELRQVEVEVEPVAPAGLGPLVSAAEARTLGCLCVGVAVPRLYVDPDSNIAYPVRLRALQRALGKAIGKTAVDFAQLQTTFPTEGYRELGGRTLGDATSSIDRRLADLDNELQFLLAVTPSNPVQAWEEFQRRGFQTQPAFHYRPLAVDPDLYRRSLYELPIERVDDPTVAALLRAKRRELDGRLTMLEQRGTPRFLLSSIAEHGRVEDPLVAMAHDVLERLTPEEAATDESPYLSAVEFAALAEGEMRHYRETDPDFAATVRVRDDVSGVMVVSGDVLIGAQSRIAKVRAEALLQHEVGTHTVTDVNGRAQPLRLLAVGLPGYEETQEGLAVLAEYAVGGLTSARMAVLAARVLAARAVEEGSSFVETFRLLCDGANLSAARGFDVAMRMHRGGGLLKDAMYLRGLDAVLRYLGEGGSLDPLLVGKPALADVDVIEELLWRGVLRRGPLRPRWLDDPATQDRLAAVRMGLTVLDLAEGSSR